MRWFVNGHRPRLWRFIALLLIGYVAYLVVPVVFNAGSSPLQRVFPVIASLFFTYLILRFVTVWESLWAGTSRKR